ncbi:MAG TPA: RDD family protein [Xanthobacteraceae bacterium]|nr:RDD family protein [Xanthobacteraceae bacterium]
MTDQATDQAPGPAPGIGSATTGRISIGVDVKPHSYDPAANPELFDGILARRVVAFVIDVIILAIPLIVVWMFIFVFGIVTLGLGWALYGLLSPISVVWALFYYGYTLGGPASATIGMRAMEIEMRTWYGAPAYFLLGAVHAVVYWLSVSMLTPLILVVGFFNARGRLLHDMLVGTVVINNATRAALLRTRPSR